MGAPEYGGMDTNKEEIYPESESVPLPTVLFGSVEDQVVVTDRCHHLRIFLYNIAIVISIVGIMFITAGFVILPFYNRKYNLSTHMVYYRLFFQIGCGILAVVVIIMLAVQKYKKCKVSNQDGPDYNYKINHRITYLNSSNVVVTTFPVQIGIASFSYSPYYP